jgi:phosphohistidine phosphatase
MKLYLVQHGQAEPKEVNADRPLTQQGAADVGRLAAFIKPMGLPIGAVWHSDKPRAIQTAQLLQPSLLPAAKVVQRDGLSPKDPVDPVRKAVERSTHDLMIVGHMPFLGELASALLVGKPSADVVAFRQGGMVCLERGEDGAWRIQWMVTPDLLAGAS